MKEIQNSKKWLLILITVLTLSSNIVAQDNKANTGAKNIITLTDKTYKEQVSKGLVLVDFWASWCGPCRKMEPILTEIAKEKKLTVAKLNVDDYQTFAQSYKISGIPTMIIYKNGTEVKRITGVYSKNELLKILTPLM